MTVFNTLGAAAGMSVLLCGTALADVTAEQAWSDWQAFYTKMGATVTSTGENRDGDTLVITDATVTAQIEDFSASAVIPEMRLKELGDGTVELTLSAAFPVNVGGGDDGPATDVQIVHSNMVTIVSGDPGAVVYDTTADSLAAQVQIGESEADPVFFKTDYTLEGATIGMATAGGDASQIDMDLDIRNVASSVVSKNDVGGFGSSSENSSSEYADVKGTMQLTLPALADMASFQSAMDAGLSLSGTMTNGDGTLTQVSESPFFNMDINGNFGPGGGDFTASKDGIGYDFAGGRIDVSVGGSPTPEPIQIGIESFGLDFAMPVGKADGAQPFKMKFNLADLTMSEDAWALFDPTAELPRDPATLVIDISGEAELTEDLFNDAVMNGRVTPGTLNAVTLNQLRLDAAGVELTGEGGFTFDNSDMSMGFPKPLGAVDLAVTGINSTMDKLVAMGLLPEDQAMGARMMMGLFAVPDGEDGLTTKIEFREDGGLYANGQRLQ